MKIALRNRRLHAIGAAAACFSCIWAHVCVWQIGRFSGCNVFTNKKHPLAPYVLKDAPPKFSCDRGSNLWKLYYRQIDDKSDKCNMFLVKKGTNMVLVTQAVSEDVFVCGKLALGLGGVRLIKNAPARTRTWASGFGGRRSIL